MARIVLENFKGGLDSTRPELANESNTLIKAVGVDLSRGGDIVKAKAFAARYTLPADTFGLASIGANQVVFGSAAAPTLPVGVVYQRLQHSDSTTAMAKVIDVQKFAGLLYVIAEFADGQIFHYYDGARITSWDNIQTAIASFSEVASRMAALVAAGSTAATATSNGSTITVTGRVGNDSYILSKSTTNVSAGVNDQDLSIVSVTTAAAAVAETPAIGSFTVGQSSTGGSVDDVTVDGVTILASAVAQLATVTLTAQAVVDMINATPDIDYTASLVGADVVKITADAGFGATLNGDVVAVDVTAPVTVSGISNIASGVTAVAAVKQVDTVTPTGTFEEGDVFQLTVDGETFTVNTAIGFVGQVAKTLGDKVYSTVGSLLRFSGVAEPLYWENQDPGPPVVVGAGFINMSNQDGDTDDLVGLGIYQSRLAILSRNSTQIWSMDVDPDLNVPQQVIPNVGTVASKSVKSFGDVDLFFLSDKGVRSLRVRDSSTFAAVSDVGTPIDSLVIAHMKSLADETVADSVAAIDPVDGRYMIAIGNKLYVYSFFPRFKVTGWTEYNPGLVFSNIAVNGNEIFARSGDIIYQYGGEDGTDRVDGAEVILPWLDANSVGTWKSWQGLDMICEGTWAIYAASDPENPDSYQLIANVSASTIGKARVPFESHSPVVKFKFVNTGTVAASISAVSAVFKAAEDD